MPFSFREREKSLSYLKNREWDCVVIGGGITGAAVARDAALRGLKVALLEAEDFASGTSSGSSKLIHGGLRYLENFEFGLVREAIHERESLRRLYAPFVQDLHFVFPTYTHQPPPRWKLNIGLTLYDFFASFRDKHTNVNAAEARAKFAMLNRNGLTGACVYTDSFAEDYRLVIELVKSAHRHSAVCLNRLKVEGLQSLESGRVELTARDLLSGTETFVIRANAIFNCTGPYADRVREKLGLSPTLQLTQGVHFLLPKERLPIDKAFVLSDPRLHRILFAIPWGPTTYLGTTDTTVARPEDAKATSEDVAYVLSIANRFFNTNLVPADIFQSWSGTRPLIKPADVTSNSAISREHQLEENPTNVFHLLGGKLTSHRAMADEALNKLSKKRKIGRTKVFSLPLQDALWDEKASTNPPHLARSYGRFAHDILRIDRERDLKMQKISPLFPHLVAEVIYSIQEEMCIEPLDFLKRRSSLYYWTNIANSDHLDAVKKVADIFALERGLASHDANALLEKTLLSYKRDREAFA